MFSKNDFEGHTIDRLCVITMDLLHLNPICQFHYLEASMKVKFNKEMNKYIESLPENDWNDKICGDFNTVVKERVLNKDIYNFYVDELITDQNIVNPKEEECIEEM